MADAKVSVVEAGSGALMVSPIDRYVLPLEVPYWAPNGVEPVNVAERATLSELPLEATVAEGNAVPATVSEVASAANSPYTEAACAGVGNATSAERAKQKVSRRCTQ